MFDLLRPTDQRSVTDWPLFDAVDRLFALLYQSLHRGAFDALEPDSQKFDNPVDALDLALGFLQMGLESGGEFWVGRSPGQARQSLVSCFSAL